MAEHPQKLQGQLKQLKLDDLGSGRAEEDGRIFVSAEHDTIEMCGDDDNASGASGSKAGFGWLIIVDETLRSWFFRLGEAIGKEPGYFLIVPLLLTALCGTGFQVYLT